MDVDFAVFRQFCFDAPIAIAVFSASELPCAIAISSGNTPIHNLCLADNQFKDMPCSEAVEGHVIRSVRREPVVVRWFIGG